MMNLTAVLLLVLLTGCVSTAPRCERIVSTYVCGDGLCHVYGPCR